MHITGLGGFTFISEWIFTKFVILDSRYIINFKSDESIHKVAISKSESIWTKFGRGMYLIIFCYIISSLRV